MRGTKRFTPGALFVVGLVMLLVSDAGSGGAPPTDRANVSHYGQIIGPGLMLAGIFIWWLSKFNERSSLRYRENDEQSEKKNAATGRLEPIIRFVWVTFGLLGALLHAMSARSHPWPDADYVTMAWLGFAALGLILPSVESIDLPGGGGVKFRKAKQAGEEGIANLERAVGDATNLIRSWMRTVSWLNTHLQRIDVDDDAAGSAMVGYCLERMQEAKDWMGGNEGEQIRISLWWHDPREKDLFFLFSNDFREEEGIDYRFKDDAGLIGRAFTKNNIDNIADAPSSPFFATRSSRKPGYHGLLLVPVRILDQAVGVISIDREAKVKFNSSAERVASGLAAQIAFAFSHPRTRNIVPFIPDRIDALLLSWLAEGAPQEHPATPSDSSEGSGQRPTQTSGPSPG